MRLTLLRTDPAAGPGAAPEPAPACSLAAFEPSLHFVDFIHALDDDAAGCGGTSSSRAPRRTLMSMHRLTALSMICGSMSFSCELRSSLSVLSRRSVARSGSRAQSALAPIGPGQPLTREHVRQGWDREGRERVVCVSPETDRVRRGGVFEGAPGELGPSRRELARLPPVTARPARGADECEPGSDRRQKRPSGQWRQGS